MTPEEFRKSGHEVIEWIARYMEEVGRFPVRSRAEPGEVYDALPSSAPEQPEAVSDILHDLDRVVMPGITHWQSPNFFAYFPANTSGPSILGDVLCAGLGVQGMLWATSPACTELEVRVLDWIAEFLDLPAHFRSQGAGGAVIQDTASSATLCALLAARERALGGSGNRSGLGTGSAPLVAYTSTHAHSSVEKAVRIAGIGSENLRCVAVDDAFSMDPSALASAMRADVAAGCRPFFVTATLGTTGVGAFDPLAAIAKVAKVHGAWLHVDAAMFGTAACCPEYRWMHDGLAAADSYGFNPHKWMLTGFDCNCFYVADRQALISALSILPEYLRTSASESGKVIDYRDWQVPLGRRFRALKLWMVLRSFGTQAIRTMVRRHVAWAEDFARCVERDPRFEIVAPRRLTLVCFRHRGGDEASEQIMESVNASGSIYISHTELDERFTLRFCVGQATTTREHVLAAWRTIADAADAPELSETGD